MSVGGVRLESVRMCRGLDFYFLYGLLAGSFPGFVSFRRILLASKEGLSSHAG